MKYLKNIYQAALLLLIASMASCGNDELNSEELKVYVKTGLQNQMEMALIITPIGLATDSFIEFPLRSTRELLADTEVALVVDESLVESYNASNETGYKLLNNNSYTITPQVTIKKGTRISEVPVRVKITSTSELADTVSYLIPVCLENLKSKDKGVELSTNFNVVYVIVNSKSLNIVSEKTEPSGTLAEKTGWRATATTEYNSYKASNLIDGNASTVWFGHGQAELTFDMGTGQTMNAIRLTPNYTAFNTSYYISKAAVLTSSDNLEWEKQGETSMTQAEGSSNLKNPDYTYIRFYAPVKARYFRIQVIAVPNSYGSLAEVDIYK